MEVCYCVVLDVFHFGSVLGEVKFRNLLTSNG